jgi:F0F1-type ATP synthase membrane subunit b/b'
VVRDHVRRPLYPDGEGGVAAARRDIEGRRDRIAADLDAAERRRAKRGRRPRLRKGAAQARSKASGIAEEARSAAKAKADAQRPRPSGLSARLVVAETRITEIRTGALGGRRDCLRRERRW